MGKNLTSIPGTSGPSHPLQSTIQPILGVLEQFWPKNLAEQANPTASRLVVVVGLLLLLLGLAAAAVVALELLRLAAVVGAGALGAPRSSSSSSAPCRSSVCAHLALSRRRFLKRGPIAQQVALKYRPFFIPTAQYRTWVPESRSRCAWGGLFLSPGRGGPNPSRAMPDAQPAAPPFPAVKRSRLATQSKARPRPRPARQAGLGHVSALLRLWAADWLHFALLSATKKAAAPTQPAPHPLAR